MGYIIDVGMAAARRCSLCGKRFSMEKKPKLVCPKCGGELLETEERQRKTPAGFATRKECEAAGVVAAKPWDSPGMTSMSRQPPSRFGAP